MLITLISIKSSSSISNPSGVSPGLIVWPSNNNFISFVGMSRSFESFAISWRFKKKLKKLNIYIKMHIYDMIKYI